MGWYESGAKPAAQRKKDKEREDGALISSFESLDSALPEAVVSMSGLFLGVPLGVGFLSFLTCSFLPDTTSSSGLRVSRWPRLTERAQFGSWCVQAGSRADEQSGGGEAEEGEGVGGGTQRGAARGHRLGESRERWAR